MKTKFTLSNRILSLALALVMVLGMLPTISFTASAAEPEYDGVIGELYYKVDEENNVTTIFGNGALSSVSSLANVMTSNVVIEEGVTSIGNNAFRGLASLGQLTVKGDVTIGNYAFQGCASLETVTFMGNVTKVGRYAFYGCASLSNINYYGTTEPSYTDDLSDLGYITLYSSNGVPFCGLTPSNPPATEASTWGVLGSIIYTDGVTQYLLYENYLYKVAYANIKDSTRITFIRVGSGESKTLAISYNGLGFLYQVNNYLARTEHMPKTPGESLECYPDSATAGYIVEKDKPVVIITCMAVGDPVWNWNGTSSATAKFTSTDGSATMTVDATIESAEQAAASCLEKGKVTYTATATANGQTYTDTKTVYGDVGPHSYTYSASGNTVTEACANCSDHTATAVLTAADAAYTGSAITSAAIAYSDNWQGDKPTDISYVNNVDVGTATATITVEGQTLTEDFQIKNAYSVSFNANGGSGEKSSDTVMEGEEYTLPANPFTAPSGYQFKGWATSQNGDVLQDGKITVSENVTLYAIWEKIPAEMPTVAVSENLTLTYGEYTGQKFTATVEKKDGYTYEYQWIDGHTVISHTDTLEIPDDLAAGEYGYYLAVGAKRTDNGEITWYSNPNLLVTVNQKTLNASNVTLSQAAFTYDGSEQRPTVAVSVSGKALTENTDYTVTWPSDCKNAGTKTVTVAFNGNYSGSAQVDYEIKQKEIGISWDATLPMPYNGESKVPNAAATGLVSDDTCTLTTDVAETEEGAGIIPGTWTAKVVALSNSNYKLPESGEGVSVTFEIVNGSQDDVPVVSGVNETIAGKADGKITGVDSTMEYRKDGESTYTAISGTEVTDLAVGTYYVRYAAKQYYNASADTAVTVAAGRKLTVTVPQNQVGYTMTTTTPEVDWHGSIYVEFKLLDGYSMTDAFEIYNGNEPMWQNFNQQTGVLKLTFVGDDFDFTVEGVADITPPAAEITLGTNKWSTFLNNITFGLFFKETQEVTITASDNGSGVNTIQYHLAGGELSKAEVEQITEWEDYNGTFKIDPNNKYIVYAKVTDKAGNAAYVNSDGVVLYTDSTLDTTAKDKITYVLTKNAEQSFSLNLNGNTVDYVKIGNTVLGNGDYEVLGNMVFISGEVLEALAAGEYTVTVGIAPMGENFISGEAPREVTIPLVVEKAVVDIDISDSGKVYDGTPVSADYEISKSSDSSPAASNISYNEKVEYKVYGEEDSTYTEEAPVKAGKYTVRISVAETDKITSATETADFTVDRKAVSVTATVPDKVYDGTAKVDTSAIVFTVSGLANGETVGVTVKEARYSGPKAGQDKQVFIVFNVTGDTVENYVFPTGGEYTAPNYYVEATADITAKTISDAFIILGDALTYNGAEQTQTVKKVVTSDDFEVTYDVSGNAATHVGVYVLTVKGNGNFTGKATVSYEIAPDASGIDALSADTVTSADKDAIEAVKSQIENAVTDLADGETKEKYKEIADKCDELLDELEKAAQAANTESTGKVEDVTAENVTPENKTDLENAKADLEKALEDNGGNYTADEKKAIEDEVERIEQALEVVSNVEAVEEKINSLPNTIKKADEEAIKAADDAYNALSDYEKSLVDEEVKKALDDAKADIERIDSWTIAFVAFALIIVILIIIFLLKRKKKEENA